MKTFKDYTIDEQNDFNLFNEIKADFNAITHFIDSKLNASRCPSATEFHNNLVTVRTILNSFVDTINHYENEDKNITC